MAAHKGFSLLEIIITLLLSAIILTAVMQIAFRATQQDAFAKKHVNKDVKVMMMHMQLLQDVSGLCALVYEDAEKSDEKKSAEKSQQKDAKQPDDVKKYFYSVNKDNHLDFFTFVTTNTLTFYGQKPEPLVRVTYRLTPGKEEGAGLVLSRKETAHLSYEDSEKSEKYAVILDGIKKFEASYFYVKPEKEEKSSSEKSEKKSEKKSAEKEELPELASQKEWGIKKDDDQESQEQKIPRYIFIECECENGLKKSFWYEIPFVFEGIPQLPKLTPSKKAPEQKSENLEEGAGNA